MGIAGVSLAQSESDKQLLKQMADMNRSNFESIRTWSGEMDMWYSFKIHKKNSKTECVRQIKYQFAVDFSSGKSMYLAHQYKANGVRNDKSIDNENDLSWGAITTPDKWYWVDWWDRSGRSIFPKKPQLVIDSKPRSRPSIYAGEFGPSYFFRLSGDYDFAFDFLKFWYENKWNEKSPLKITKNNNIITLERGDINTDTFDISKGCNIISQISETRDKIVQRKCDLEKIGDTWIVYKYELLTKNKIGDIKKTYIKMRFTNHKLNQELNPNIFDPKILMSEKPESILDRRTFTGYQEIPKKPPSLPPAPQEEPERDPGESSSYLGWLVGAVGMLCALGFGGFFYFRRSP